MDLKQIKELLAGVENACLELQKETQMELAQVATQKTKLADKAKSLDEREAHLAEKEKGFAKRESEVETKFAKIRDDEQIRAERVAIEQQKGIMQEEADRVREEKAEVQILLREVEKREMALSLEKEAYKTKIKQQVAEGLIGKINA